MKNFNDVKHELANELGFSDWHELQKQYPKAIYRYYEQASKIYAKQVAEDVRQRCADNSVNYHSSFPSITKMAILTTEIILP